MLLLFALICFSPVFIILFFSSIPTTSHRLTACACGKKLPCLPASMHFCLSVDLSSEMGPDNNMMCASMFFFFFVHFLDAVVCALWMGGLCYTNHVEIPPSHHPLLQDFWEKGLPWLLLLPSVYVVWMFGCMHVEKDGGACCFNALAHGLFALFI